MGLCKNIYSKIKNVIANARQDLENIPELNFQKSQKIENIKQIFDSVLDG